MSRSPCVASLRNPILHHVTSTLIDCSERRSKQTEAHVCTMVSLHLAQAVLGLRLRSSATDTSQIEA